MPIKGISDAVRDPIEDLPDYPQDGQLPDGRPWPPRDGPQPWSPLWRKIAETLGRIEKHPDPKP